MSRFLTYVFQQSQIFEAGDPVDPNGQQMYIRAKTEQTARRLLPHPGVGRRWVLVKGMSGPWDES